METKSYSFEERNNSQEDEKIDESQIVEQIINNLDTQIGEGNTADVLIDADFPNICFKLIMRPGGPGVSVNSPEREIQLMEESLDAIDKEVVPQPYFNIDATIVNENNEERPLKAFGMERIHGVNIEQVIFGDTDIFESINLSTKKDLKELRDKFKKLEAEIKKINEEGIIHNDVNPRNIMLDKDGDVFLIDFGMAEARTQLQSENIPKKDIEGLRNVRDKFMRKAKKYLKNNFNIVFENNRENRNITGPLP